jgi:hypothetical protein
MARMNASRENKCPNCGLVERATHLNVCPSVARTRLLTEGTELLENWLYQDCRTNRELAYWLIKYILLRGTRPMASLRPMSDSMHRAAISQEDAIGWREFMEGKVCKEIAAIQEAHCAISSCRMNGTDWMKHFISHLLHLSHSQWICRNITLHDKLRGTLLLRKWGDVIKELDSLIETDPEEIPVENAVSSSRPRLNTSAVTLQLQADLGLCPRAPISNRHPAFLVLFFSASDNPCNKRLQKNQTRV